MNHHPLHLDTNYTKKTTQFSKNIIINNYIYSILLGISIPNINNKTITNLKIESLHHIAPTFHNNTIYNKTTILNKRENTNKNDHNIIHIKTKNYKQNNTLIYIFHHKIIIPKQNYLNTRNNEQPKHPKLRKP